MTMNSSQGVYAPLPQSLSDSDSDKELNEPTRMTFPTRKLQNGHDPRITHNGYSIPNHVINMKAKRGFGAMSPARKCAFISSIALCFLVIVVFLWVLPCSNQGTCPMRITSWKNEHDGVEFKGGVNVIRGPYGNSISLALLAKKTINSVENQSGAIALKSTSGAFVWFVPHMHPYELNCNLIDVNKDGVSDCLLLGEIGLEVIDPLSSKVIWYAHNKDTLLNIDFPKVLTDLNDDGIFEMISVSNSNLEHNKVVIICGRTGQILSSFVLKECSDVTHFKFEEDVFIYLCENEELSNYYKITLADLKGKFGNGSYMVKPKRIEYHPKTDEDYILNGRRLLIENFGTCPQCSTRISVLEETSEKSLYDSTYDKTYSMRPISFAFKPSQDNIMSLRGHINGFILKLWQWSDYSAQTKRSVAYNNTTVNKFNISEKVVLITFNDTNVHVINVSYIPITQLCYPNHECQPDLANCNDSLLISDLDFDGSQELISYSSTYQCTNDSKEKCQLVSSMEVIRLEAELPKLYAK